MAKFRFLQTNHWAIVGGENVNLNGGNLYIEVEEGAIADACRTSTIIHEVSRIPPNILDRYLSESNMGAEYPLPDFSAMPCVVIGRGLSSLKFWERYPRGEYIRIGVNPGSCPEYSVYDGSNERLKAMQPSHDTDGVHGDAESLANFEAICSVDSTYMKRASSAPSRYAGPFIGVAGLKEEYAGPGTFHACDKYARITDYVNSMNYALQVVAGAHAKEIIVCGMDFDQEGYDDVGSDPWYKYNHGYASRVKAMLEKAIPSVESMGAVVYFDKDCKVRQEVHGRPLWLK